MLLPMLQGQHYNTNGCFFHNGQAVLNTLFQVCLQNENNKVERQLFTPNCQQGNPLSMLPES